MSRASTQFEATGDSLNLAAAILLYRSSGAGSASAFASIHPVEHDGAGPTIGAGAPLTRSHLRQWTAALGRAAAPEILPDNVLVAHADLLAWWVPAQVRTAFFALSQPPKGLKVLAERTSLRLPYPAHLFIATRARLGVYALAESRRPTAETVVMHSPVLNVFLDGNLCWGNIARPKTLSIAAMGEFEDAVFDSWSTHPNQGQESTVTGKGGLVRLWDSLAAQRAQRFPVRRLTPFNPSARRQGAEPITLEQLIARSVR